MRAVSENAGSAAVLAAMMIALRWKLRRGRLSSRQILRLEFEELPEPAVQLLSIRAGLTHALAKFHATMEYYRFRNETGTLASNVSSF